MIRPGTLENISIDELLEIFNLSFSDYLIPLCLTKEQLEYKIKSDSIQLAFSVGIFENNQLIAFVLHGYDIADNLKIVFNAGTGVIPDKRGNRLTAQMYEYILPVLKKHEIHKVQLEVIIKNEVALRAYTNIGFKIVRQLNCVKGSINSTHTGSGFEFRKLEIYDWVKLASFWDMQPAWQNSITAVEKLKESNISVGLYEGEKLAGYIIYNPVLKRVHQFSVDRNCRKSGIGSALFNYIASNYEKNITIINIDERAKETLQFLTALGMNDFIQQYEMELALK